MGVPETSGTASGPAGVGARPAVSQARVTPAALLAATGAGVYATDADGLITFINPAALRLLGREAEDLTGQSMHELAHYEDATGRSVPASACPLLSVIRTGTAARSDDDTFWQPDGTALAVSWISAPVLDPDARCDGTAAVGAVVMFSDASLRHVENERLLAEHEATLEAHARLALTAGRLAMLDRVGEALSVLDKDESLRRLARLTVGKITDWCVVDAVEGPTVRRVAVSHRDPATFPEQKYVRPMPPLLPEATGSLARALVSGAQQVVDLSPSDRAAAGSHAVGAGGPVGAVARVSSDDPLDLEQAALFDELGCAHALVTPIVARHQVLGAMTWVRSEADKSFDEDDAFLAAEIARRAALTLENARLYSQQRDAAEALQRSLLTVLPEPDHLHVVARYLPASRGVEVGGDWYDSFLLPDGATSLVIGDILGHDLTAAAHMGQVRNLLRAIAADRLAPPSEILGRLDAVLERLRVGTLATCLFARIEQSPAQAADGMRQLRWSSAGHLPAAVVSPIGRVRLLEQTGDVMLGVAPELSRSDHVTAVHPGDTIWLYTDGLIERSDQGLDVGLARLRRALAPTAALPLETAIDRLLDRMLPAGHADDVAVLAVRAHPMDRPRPAEAGPSRG